MINFFFPQILYSALLRLQFSEFASDELQPFRDNLYNPVYFGNGGIYRELTLSLLFSRPFPEALEHHNSDFHYARVATADTVSWFGCIQVNSGQVSLKKYQNDMQKMSRIYGLRSQVLFLFASLQFAKGVRTLSSDISSSNQATVAIQMHLGAVLGIEKILDVEPLPYNYIEALVDYSGSLFDLAGQLRFLKLLPAEGRREAYLKVLGVYNFSEEIIGRIRNDGGHEKGPLEECFLEVDPDRGLEDFQKVMASTGQQALRRGHYVEALRMLHLGGKHEEVV